MNFVFKFNWPRSGHRRVKKWGHFGAFCISVLLAATAAAQTPPEAVLPSGDGSAAPPAPPAPLAPPAPPAPPPPSGLPAPPAPGMPGWARPAAPALGPVIEI